VWFLPGGGSTNPSGEGSSGGEGESSGSESGEQSGEQQSEGSGESSGSSEGSSESEELGEGEQSEGGEQSEEGGEQQEGEQSEQPVGQTESEEESSEEEESDPEEEEQEQEEKSQKQQQKQPPPKDDFTLLMEKCWEMRDYLTEQEEMTHEAADTIGMRPFEDGAEMLRAGIPLAAVLDAATMDWSDEARAANGIEEVDQGSIFPAIDGEHKVLPYVLRLIAARIPVALIGPAGTGKTYLARSIARVLSAPFEQVSCAEGISTAWFAGRNMPEPVGFVETGFLRTYRDGGVFLLDELDAADPNTTLLLNGSIAGDRFDNPVNDSIIHRANPPEQEHPALFVGALNTMGTGADNRHVGRNALDGALLDRFRMGRVRVGYDRALERKIIDAARAAGPIA
jgi:hypothetical protein